MNENENIAIAFVRLIVICVIIIVSMVVFIIFCIGCCECTSKIRKCIKFEKKLKKTNSEEICVICFDEEGEKIEIKTCKHIFHKECLKEWVHNGQGDHSRCCPVCLQIIV